MYVNIYLYPYYGTQSCSFFSTFPASLPTKSRIAVRSPPGATWSRLGAVLGPSWAPLPPPGAVLGPPWAPIWTPLGPSWGHLSAFATKKAILSKVCVFPRFWPLFGLLRSLAAVKLGSTWGQFCNFNEVRRNSSLRCSSEHVLVASRSHSFRSGRPKARQEGPKEAPKGPQRGGPEGGKTGYEIGLELEGLFGPILEPFGSSS